MATLEREIGGNKPQDNGNRITITFGEYKGEAISWIVLDEKDGKKLLLSEMGIDVIKFNEKCEDTTWGKCTLRKWLNSDFFMEAFSKKEQEKIETVTVTADKNPKYDTDSGNDTRDKIFLLSMTEAEKYFDDDVDRMSCATEYALSKEPYLDDYSNAAWWCLRSPGDSGSRVAVVHWSGFVYEQGVNVRDDGACIRPALWINMGD